MTDEPLPRELERLLDTARSEAKARGHKEVTAGHLLVALVRDHAEKAARFDEEALAEVETSLAGVAKSFDEPQISDDTRSLLEACRGADPLEHLVEQLSSRMSGSARTPVSASKAPSRPGPRPTSTDSGPAVTREPVPAHLATYVAEVAPNRGIYGRERAVREIIGLLSTRSPVTPLVVATEGAGRTSLLGAIAAHVADVPTTHPLAAHRVLRVVPEAVIATRRAETLMRIVTGVGASSILCFDDVEVLGGLGSSLGVDLATFVALRATVAGPARPMVLLLARDYVDRFRAVDRELLDELAIVDLPELPPELVRLVAVDHARALAVHHGVAIPESAVGAACGPPHESDLVTHPSLAILRLDRAAARARGDGRDVASADVGFTGPTCTPFDPVGAADRLGAVVIGQQAVVRRVVDRLSVTRAQLDTRPDRPDGVFLFVGPTGVGKTALAHALAQEVYGREDAVIRLDMSEYAESHTVSKLIGSPPGYVGSTDPEGWLSTRIRANPRVVVVLDEIEKAHPQVWNTFLQVFDAGRLTDSQGRTAHFRDTVIVMTSNLGANAFATGAPVGFGDRTTNAAAEEGAVLRSVKERMAPELVNRIDDVLVFRPFDRPTVEAIARKEIAKVKGRLQSRGYDVTIGDDVLALVIEAGFSREYGARPLQRSIERLVLSPVARLTPGAYRARVVEGALILERDAQAPSGP